MEDVEKVIRKIDKTGTCKNTAIKGGLRRWDKQDNYKFSQASEWKDNDHWAYWGRQEIRAQLQKSNAVKCSQQWRKNNQNVKAKAAKVAQAAAAQRASKRKGNLVVAETSKKKPAPDMAITADMSQYLDEATIHAIFHATAQVKTAKENGRVVTAPGGKRLRGKTGKGVSIKRKKEG